MLSVGDLVRSTGRPRSDGELLHVDAGSRVEHRAPVGHRYHGEGATPAQGGERRPLDRVDRYVGLGWRAVADALAVEKHGSAVLLTLADHDDPVHGDRLEDHAHRVHRGRVGPFFLAAPHPPPGGECRRLGGPDELHREVPVGRTFLLDHRARP